MEFNGKVIWQEDFVDAIGLGNFTGGVFELIGKDTNVLKLGIRIRQGGDAHKEVSSFETLSMAVAVVV